MKKKECLLIFVLFFSIYIFSISTYAKQEAFSDKKFLLEYDSDQFAVDVLESGNLKINSIVNLDDGGGHNTVLGCMRETNTAYENLGKLSYDEVLDFQKTFVYEMCRGLFEVDNGIAIIADGYSAYGSACEYFMILSDGTECYVKVYNYGEDVYYSACRLCPYSKELNDGFRSIYDSIELINDGQAVSEKEIVTSDENWEAEYYELQSENEELHKKYDTLLEKYGTKENDLDEINYSETESESFDSKVSSKEAASDKEYADMLIKYGDIFTEELSVFSNQKISQLIKDNASVDELMEEISLSMSQVSTAEENLQNYYEQFDSNRTELPMGTPIMTLLSDAQSALRQYAIALQKLQDYFSDPQQEYIDDFVKYTEKATESLNDFNDLLKLEKSALKTE